MYTSAIQTNERNSKNDRLLMCWWTTSAIEPALWRTEAVSAVMSWTPPMKIEPIKIQIMAGSQPKARPAAIGPTIGPAAAMAEKCWLIRNFGSIGS